MFEQLSSLYQSKNRDEVKRNIETIIEKLITYCDFVFIFHCSTILMILCISQKDNQKYNISIGLHTWKLQFFTPKDLMEPTIVS